MAVLEVNNIEKHSWEHTSSERCEFFPWKRAMHWRLSGHRVHGKTTLLRCLNFLETPNQGTISVNGETVFDASRIR